MKTNYNKLGSVNENQAGDVSALGDGPHGAGCHL
jgi:hypothetical protein